MMKSYEIETIITSGLNALLNLKYEKRLKLLTEAESGKIKLPKNGIESLNLEVIAFKYANNLLNYKIDQIKKLSYEELLKGKPEDYIENSQFVRQNFTEMILEADLLRGQNEATAELYANSEFDDFHFTFLKNTDFIYHESVIKKRFENRIGRELFFKTNRERKKRN